MFVFQQLAWFLQKFGAKRRFCLAVGNFSCHSWPRLHPMPLLVFPESPVLSSKSPFYFLAIFCTPFCHSFPPKLSRPFIYGLLHFLHTSVRAYAIVFVSFTCLFLPVNSKLVHVVEHVFIHLCMPRSSIYAFVWAGGVKNRQGGCFGASKPPEI